MKIIIIGGGASGIAAAISAAKHATTNTVVQILESNSRVGKKLLTTGNGKCNITNIKACAEFYNKPEFVRSVFNQYGTADTLDFFQSAGLMYYSDAEGRVYPYSNSSATVLNLLSAQCENLGVEILTDTTATAIEKNSEGFFVVCESQGAGEGITAKKTIKCDVIIYAVGSAAGLTRPIDNCSLLKQFDIKTVENKPALSPIRTMKKDVEGLSGVRIKAGVKLQKDGSTIFEEGGEVHFREDGLSGIVIFNASLMMARSCDKNSEYCIILDLIPEYTEEALTERFHKLGLDIKQYLDGIFNYKITNKIIKNCGNSGIEAVVTELKNMRFRVLESFGLPDSQVCCGGISTECIDKSTLESRVIKGLFFAGEAIDVDGVCGGLNLQWAWSSGFLAGKNAAQKACFAPNLNTIASDNTKTIQQKKEKKCCK